LNWGRGKKGEVHWVGYIRREAACSDSLTAQTLLQGPKIKGLARGGIALRRTVRSRQSIVTRWDNYRQQKVIRERQGRRRAEVTCARSVRSRRGLHTDEIGLKLCVYWGVVTPMVGAKSLLSGRVDVR